MPCAMTTLEQRHHLPLELNELPVGVGTRQIGIISSKLVMNDFLTLMQLIFLKNVNPRERNLFTHMAP